MTPAADGSASRSSPSARTLAYVWTVAVAAIGLAMAAAYASPGLHLLPTGYAVVFAVMIAAAERLQIRYVFSQGVEALTLVDALFAPLIFCGSGVEVAVIVAAGMVIAGVSGGNPALKTLFNAAQWTAAVSVGAIAFHASGASHAASSANMLALVGAMLAVWIVNQLLISGVLWATSGHPLGSDDTRVVWLVVAGRCAGFVGTTVLGLLMTAAYLAVHWVAPLAMVPLVFLWSAGRAETSLRADRRLLDALQRATHHLGTSLDLDVALPPSLAEARAGFEVKEVQLVLVAEHGFPTTYRSTEDDEPYQVETGPHGLAELLVDNLIEPARLGPNSGDAAGALARMGYQRALAAPLRARGTSFGVLLFLDREGAEGFEEGELSIAGALARELVGFLGRIDLVTAIDNERQMLTDIVEHTDDGIISIDVEGTILSWNSAMETITGYSADEMINTRHFGLLRPRDSHDADLQIIGWAQRYAATGQASEIQIVTVDGATVWLSCSYSLVPGRDGGPDSLIIVARNITKARELELLKDDFIAVVSHELRTPLVPIKGWAQTLLNRGERLNETQRRTALQSILTQAQRLEALVLNILEASRVEAGQAEALDIVDVAAVAVHVVEDVLAARPDRVIRVRPPLVPCSVRGSTVWVDRALANLVANAVKYSPDDTPVDVVITSDDRNVVVSVTDRGPGISEDAQERVFERFERLGESRKQTGTGLGLYITRRLARAMGGEVTLSSLPGAGSTFVMTLPAVAADIAPRRTVDTTTGVPTPREEPSPNVLRLR